ncbi:hypothetical protein [Devosia sp. FKR38]|uniref:hypothetical protein n=1 Tax=Devosia sp. FKR38 TaxID=2562312 RepID=UPI0010C15634|nr:hypothetical protein [Devosia sp. FKR38]
MRAFVLPSLAVVVGLLTALPAQAALPPQYQRQAELAAIIADMGVADAFGFSGVDAIELIAPDHYLVRGGACVLSVTIEDVPNTHEAGWAGPREFKLVLGTPACSQ